jgi:hypothetical protein
MAGASGGLGNVSRRTGRMVMRATIATTLRGKLTSSGHLGILLR